MHPFHRLSVFLCLALLPSISRAEEWQMIFKVTTVTSTENEQGRSSEKGSAPSHWVVRLGQNHLCLTDKTSLTVHDFQSVRTLRFVGGLRTADQSLYAVAARREADFLREINAISVLQKAGLGAEDLGTLYYELENRMALLTGLPHDTLPVRSRDGAGNYTYLLNNRFMASYQLSDISLPENRRAMFAKFLLYAFPMHPRLSTEICGYHRVPSRLKLRHVDSWRTTFTTLELISAGPAPDDLYDDAKRARLPAEPASRLGRLIRRSLDPAERDRQPATAADYAARFKMAAEQGFYTDAMLLALECHLQLGEETDRAIDALLPYTPRNPDLGNFLAALTLAGDRATVEKSLEALSKVNRDLLLRKHLYDFALANSLAQTGRYRQAEDLFFVALEKNPLMAGVYVKLGQLYMETGRMEDAWACWDTARMLCPKHSLLEIPDQLEVRLKTGKPGYF